MASKRPRGRTASKSSPLEDAERTCGDARGDDAGSTAAFATALAEYANLLAEDEHPLGELLRLAAGGAPESEEKMLALRAACVAPLYEKIPTIAGLDDMETLSDDDCARVPISGGRMEVPFELVWRGGLVHEATFEVYDQSSPLGEVSAEAYRTFLTLPACRLVRRLAIGNVACRDFENASLLGDPFALLARDGIPPYLERLTVDRFGPVSNSGDLGYIPASRFTPPLMKKLDHVLEIHLGGCEDLRKLSLPKLRVLSMLDNVTAKTLIELARAYLPALDHLVLRTHNAFHLPESRYHAVRALLHTDGLPRLTNLELLYLDLDDDMRETLDASGDAGDDGDAPGETGPWVDMIADSPVLRRLSRLSLFFHDDDRELPRLLARAADFQHLSHLEFSGASGAAALAHPTKESIAAVLARLST